MRSKCSKGEIKRNTYVKKDGTIVKEGCIIAQSQSGSKTSKDLKKYLSKKNIMHKKAIQKFGKSKCSKDSIMKEGYKRKPYTKISRSGSKTSIKSTWVAPTCIKSNSKGSKRNKVITIMEKDVLEKYGYINVKNLPITKRHSCLNKAIHEIKPLSIYRRLIAIATLNKNKDKELFDILREDAEYVKKYHIV
jgi:hypothetical protein